MGKRNKNKWKKIKEVTPAILRQLINSDTADEVNGDKAAVSESNSAPDQSYRIEKWCQYSNPNPAMLRHVLVSEGYKVFQWSDVPGCTYATHRHETAQSHWIISGLLELTIERCGTFILETGDRDFMPAGTYHSARVIGDEPAIYLVGEKC